MNGKKLMNIRLVLAQINSTVGDIAGNTEKIISCMEEAGKLKADIAVFPELAVTGYPPEDLLLKPRFVNDNMDALERIETAAEGIITIVGYVDGKKGLYNAAAVISNGKIADIYHKKHLPNYGVFDEYRYFQAGKRYPLYYIGDFCFGVNVCEDIWMDEGPLRVQALSGAELILNMNASPYHMGKGQAREEHVSKLASEFGVTIAYLNMVGGQDELVFDGGSFVAGPDGVISVRGKLFGEDLVAVDVEVGKTAKAIFKDKTEELKRFVARDEHVDRVDIPFVLSERERPEIAEREYIKLSLEEEVYDALILGTRDYVLKNGFRGVVIGMSGGVDSALTTTVAVDALGRENVRGLFMPSQYTSDESREDALGHAENLGIKVSTVSIDSIYGSYLDTLSEHFAGREPDITEENLQARIRGNLLMAFSNKFGLLVLTTGNKSEMSVGYATLYGDMAGGFAVIKDVPKTLVYRLCEWRNAKAGRELIPGRILWKEPTAELKPDQKDTDSLPPYPVLDPILKAYVEEYKSLDAILETGCDVECARKVISMIDHSEYKRRQAPPGVKITPRAFGKDRRFPITNRYRNY